jgi:serine/threonine protein kinase
MDAETFVEIFCRELARLLPADEVDRLRARWLRETRGPAGDAGRFSQWLIANRIITEYQAGVLSRGHADRLFIGPYTVKERVGKGRMAGVYKAMDKQGKAVAIKILPPSKAREPELLARFQREARLALQLSHPNLVRTLEEGEENGLHFIVMEYLEGDLLDDVLKRQKRLDPREAARIIYQAMLGLQCLHDQAMVHRDLKPGNIMLLPDDRPRKKGAAPRPRVKILDIGLGLGLFEEEDVEGQEFQLTNEGALLGTPDYLAPEQARDAHSVTIHADIYSLGCVFYHSLTGQPPFPDTSSIRQLVRHATETPLPLKTLNPAVPDALQPILDRMLAKEPARRYATPLEAARALKGFLLDKDTRPGGSAKKRPTSRNAIAQAAIPAIPGQPAVTNAPVHPAAVTVPTRSAIVQPARVVAATPAPGKVDVELVTAVPRAELTPELGPSAGWNRRDWLIFAFGSAAGAGTVLATGGLGLLLAKLLRRNVPDSEAPTPAGAGEQ